MSDDEHRALAQALRNVEGKVALSGYYCKLMDELYSDWHYIEAPSKKAHSTNTRPDSMKQMRVECLWINYPPEQKYKNGTDRMGKPTTILEDAFRRASKLKDSTITSLEALNRIVEVARCLNNRE